MTHIWNDGWEGWASLDKAMLYIETNLTKYGRINTWLCKEKFGSWRDNSDFWNGHIYTLFKPGYHRVGRTSYFFAKIFQVVGLVWLVNQYQGWVYNKVLQKACQKWPEIKDELLQDLSRYDLIRSGPGIDVGGKELEARYWRRL